MIEASDIPSPPFRVYPTHVLFQFILTDYLRAREGLNALEAQILQLKLPSPLGHLKTAQLEDKKALIRVVEVLAGRDSPSRGDFAWNITSGVLTTLKNNSALFHFASSQDSSAGSAIKKYALRSWIYGVELLEFATHLSIEGPLGESHEYLHLMKLQKKLAVSLKSLGASITKALKQFDTDENVLYCLVNHQIRIDGAYGQNFTAKTVKKMHKTLDRATEFLVSAYQRRGFDGLIPAISQKMNALQCAP